MNFSEYLNQEQLNGVTCTSQYTRVVAGAGSGKTRVLTYRILYLLDKMDVSPSQILGITFTNKAAKEIKVRVENLIGDTKGMTLGTIHSFCARFLRMFASEINYPKTFTILDEDDQHQVMKNVFISHDLPKNDPHIKECLNWICAKKTEGLQYEDIENIEYPNPLYNQFKIYFREYTEILRKTASLDFDDLLLKTIEVLENDENNIRKLMQRRIKHILVDEFQDINDVQFYLIRLLMGEETSLYVVGDPDQTIYTWRGANNKIMLNLEKNLKGDYPSCKVNEIILINNYRSSKNILDSANMLIANNKERIKKDLKAVNPSGESITYYSARTVGEESSYIASTIKELVRDKDYKYSSFAILYRSNYLTRELESQLNLHGVPYRIFGGLKFYQRKEIKDVLSYLNLMVNPLDDQSLERIINVPKRNIGPTSVEKIKFSAVEAGQTMYLYIKENIDNLDLPLTKIKALKSMINLIEGCKLSLKHSESKDFGEIIEKFLGEIGYYKYLEDDSKGDERKENVQELVGNIKAFFLSNVDAEFSDFTTNASLQASSDEILDGNYVSLMTVHIAKGLEYDNVFIYSFNEGVFPSRRAIEESRRGEEEERRLAYVAITRAKKKLYITSNQDYSYVLATNSKPSRFLKEAGIKIKEDNLYGYRKNTYINPYDNSHYQKKDVYVKQEVENHPANNGVEAWFVGDQVQHESFGIGKVIEVVSDKMIKVKFDDPSYGIKTLLSSHYKIKKLYS